MYYSLFRTKTPAVLKLTYQNMIVVDVESSGIDPQKCSLLSVGAIDFDTPERRFYEECRIWDGAHIENEALKVNGFARESLTDPKKQTDRELIEKFLKWVETVGEWTIAGQNPSFDRDFLIATALRYHINWPLAHRTIDLHSIAYFHMIKMDIEPPSSKNRSAINLDTILKYVGLHIERGQHNALEDTLLEAEAFYRLFYDKPLLKEYTDYKIPWKT
jgi:DNA polymerase III epsilon subunit-like protein